MYYIRAYLGRNLIKNLRGGDAYHYPTKLGMSGFQPYRLATPP